MVGVVDGAGIRVAERAARVDEADVAILLIRGRFCVASSEVHVAVSIRIVVTSAKAML